MIQSNSMYIPAVEREAFASLRVAANPSETYYFTAFDFVPEHAIELQEGETIDVHYDTFVEVDGVNACIIYQGKKYPRGFREGLQSALTPTQMAAVNSGVTAEKVEEYDALSETKFDKANVLKRSQNAPNVREADQYVPSYSRVEYMLSSLSDDYQEKLSQTQMEAVNSGINSTKITRYNLSSEKVESSCSLIKELPILGSYVFPVSEKSTEMGTFPVLGVRIKKRDNDGYNEFVGLTSKLFRLKSDAHLSIVQDINNDVYDYYFAFRINGEWVFTKEFGSDDEASIGTIDDVNILRSVSVSNYTGYPPCCIVGVRRDTYKVQLTGGGNVTRRVRLTATDLEYLTTHNVKIKVIANRTQDLNVMLEQFNLHPWETKNFDTRAELSSEFEVFPTFVQGETESADGYPAGYDHYFAVTINNTNGNEIYNFRRCAIDANENAQTNYIRVIYNAPNTYNQDFYVPINSEIEVLEGEQAMAYINTYPEDADEKNVLLSIQTGCIVYASMDAIELAPEEIETESYRKESSASTTPVGGDPED